MARRGWAMVLVLLLGLVLTAPGQACPFCVGQGQTLTGDVKQAMMVLFGTLENANEDKETTDLKVELIVKDHKVRAGRKMMTLQRYVPPPMDGKPHKFLVFFDFFEGKLDPYRGVAVAQDSKIGKYLSGALQKTDAPVPERLAFFFDYLDSKEDAVSNDAYREFANCDYKDFRTAMSTKLAKSAGRVTTWLNDPDTPAFRVGLYASMLGHSGKPADAEVLRKMLDDPDRRGSTGMDGVFAGYVLLKPKEGWKYLGDVLRDSGQEYFYRHSALRAVRFFHDYRPEVIGKKGLVDTLCLLLDLEDMADLALDDLRKWNVWDRTERILAVRKSKVFEQPIVQRALLRYCLASRGDAALSAYVAEQRKANPDLVSEAEEVLRLEQLTRDPLPPPAR